MATSSGKRSPTSPISQLLQTLGMTRDDLTRHSEQMRNFLTRENDKSTRQFTQRAESHDSLSKGSTSKGRSRTGSVSNASALARSPSPPITPVKAEPQDSSLPSRQMDAMEMVMERKSRKEKKERRGMIFASSSNGGHLLASPRPKNLTRIHATFDAFRLLRTLSQQEVPLPWSV